MHREDYLFFAGMTLIGVLVIIFGYSIWKLERSPTFELHKSEWHCTETRQAMVMIMVGKVPMMMPRQVCAQWTKD